MASDELETAELSAGKNAAYLLKMFRRVLIESRPYLRIARSREGRNLRQRSVAERGGRGAHAAGERRRRPRNDAGICKQRQHLPEGSGFGRGGRQDLWAIHNGEAGWAGILAMFRWPDWR